MTQKLKKWHEDGWPTVFFSTDMFPKLRFEDDPQPAITFFKTHPEYIHYYYGRTSLLHRFAAMRDYPELIAVLVELGMDVNVEEEDRPWGPLCSAVVARHSKTARWLLEHGAKTRYEFRGLTYSCGLPSTIVDGNLEMVKLLVEYGSPVDCLIDDPPRSALTLAMTSGQTEIAEYLRSKGALTEEEIKARTKPKRKKT